MPRYACDDAGRLLLWAVRPAAVVFSERLASHGFEALAVPVTPLQVGEVLLAGGVSDGEFGECVRLVDGGDLAALSAELADELARRVGAWGVP